jgi:hypothetical protein
MSEFDLLCNELAEMQAQRTQAAKRPVPLAKSLAALPVHTDLAEFSKLQRPASLRMAPRPVDARQALMDRVVHATSLLMALVFEGRLTALQASTFEAKIHALSAGLRRPPPGQVQGSDRDGGRDGHRRRRRSRLAGMAQAAPRAVRHGGRRGWPGWQVGRRSWTGC